MQKRKFHQDSMLRATSSLIGIILSLVLSFMADRFNLPIYPDVVGTIGVSYLCGIFPGIMTAVFTDLLSMSFNPDALYFSTVNVAIAVFTAWFVREKTAGKRRNLLIFTLIAGAISGILSGAIQWGLFQGPQSPVLASWLDASFPNAGPFRIVLFFAAQIALNMLEKVISVGIVLLIIHFIPVEVRTRIRNSGWRQRPLTVDEVKNLEISYVHYGRSIRQRMTVVLTCMSFALAVIVGVTGIRLYYHNAKADMKHCAHDAAYAASMAVDGDLIDDFAKEGRNAPGYAETADMLYYIWKGAPDVEYLYVVTIDPEYVTFLFDVDSREGGAGVEPYEPGEQVAIEAAFKPYMPALLAGQEIEPIESRDVWSSMITVYYPVHDSQGQTVAYVGADSSLVYLADYMQDFALRVLLIIAGFFILIVAYGLWTTGLYFVYPMESMISRINDLIGAGTDQEQLDSAVRGIRALDISTGDELERLYQEVCDMASNQAEQLRSVRRLADSTAKMQDGLINTMADMVENRDSDTGAHIQKTAAYVKIIVEGLKKKGYYPEKITDKFMSDVVRSAPLHDVGKINISDVVLNKPGKLTNEEFAIMKTHTTAGKHIIEHAISTTEGDIYLKEARDMAGYHHERWDGKGYPEGLHGELIPLSARIMAVADVFDALTSPRVYKPAFPFEQAVSIIEEGKGTQFDPKCVEVFMESLDEVQAISKKFNEGA